MAAVSKEINATINSYHITRSVPMKELTELIPMEDGTYEMRALSTRRFGMRIVISLIRAVMAAFMVTQGTQFLVYTTEISDLLLNAVALEFVINTDELVYEALAPSRAKRILANTTGFKMKPQSTFRGVDFRGMLTIAFVLGGSESRSIPTHTSRR